MFILTVGLIIATFIFGLAAIIFSFREEKAIKKLIAKDIEQKQRLYEITILKEVQDRIGYSLDVEKVSDVITTSLDSFFTYSTVSSMVIKGDKMLFKGHLQESVSHPYIELIKDGMLRSLKALRETSASEDEALPTEMTSDISGVPFDDINHVKPLSYFHIPIIVNGRVVGLITISSSQANRYTEQEMTIIYKIADSASLELSHLENILSIEKGKLVDAIGSLTDGLMMIDVSGQVTVINKAAKDFLALDKDNPTTIDILSALPNSYDFSSKIQRAINHKRNIEEKEVNIDDKIFQVLITPVYDASVTSEKRVIGVCVILHDITLEKSIAQIKEDFTNVMVHELRSPLTAIKASTDLLLPDIKEDGSASDKELSVEERRKVTQLISTQSRKMLDQISLILDAAKLESGVFSLQKTKEDLKKILEDKAAIFTAAAKEKFVTIVTEIDPSLPSFAFDPIRIGQVINNLISNSLKFTPSGGTISIKAKPAIENVIVSVSDTGAGVPKEKQHLLFSKFAQLRTAHPEAGTGLGLYFVKGIVEAHGGSVTLESEEGRGTTITFTLPIEDKLEDKATPRLSQATSSNLHMSTHN